MFHNNLFLLPINLQIISPIVCTFLIYFSDTYVTTQLCENERRFLTRRTGIVRQISTPLYRQTVKYLTSDVARRVLVATMWSRVPPEAKYDPMNLVGLVNEGDERIGIANIDIDKLVMRQLIVGWYKLFPSGI